MPMTGSTDRVEVITSVQRRRRWSAEEKTRIVEETYAPGMSVSLVARQHGVAPNQVFKWRQLYAQGALSAVGAGEEVVSASEYRALQHQVRELQRLLGKKTLENEIPGLRRGRLCVTRSIWHSQKNGCCGRPCPLARTSREASCRDAWGGALEPRRAGRSEHNAAAPGPAPPAGNRTAGRNQNCYRRTADPGLPHGSSPWAEGPRGRLVWGCWLSRLVFDAALAVFVILGIGSLSTGWRRSTTASQAATACG